MSFAAKYQHDLFLNNSLLSQHLTFFWFLFWNAPQM